MNPEPALVDAVMASIDYGKKSNNPLSNDPNDDGIVTQSTAYGVGEARLNVSGAVRAS